MKYKWEFPRQFLLLLFLGGLMLALSFYFDETMRWWIARHQNASAKIFMRNVSRFGDWPEHAVLGLALLAIAYWRRNKKWVRIFLAMLVALALAGTAARVIKIGAGRARPSVQTETAWNGPKLSARYNAFPSGHTAGSTAFFVTLAFVSWRIGVGFLLVPLLIAFSRMYVAAHYLSDVVCAALLGILVAYCVARWARLGSARGSRAGFGGPP
ncbi:MAG: phosphatase PAP2 family protein, partial [Verrucomicrobiota bacterium]